MRDEWLKIRVTGVELEGWEAQAEESGLNLSEWVRQKLNAEDAHKVAESVAKRLDDKVNPEADPPTRQKVKTCVHGVQKGWHCWQCRGVA